MLKNSPGCMVNEKKTEKNPETKKKKDMRKRAKDSDSHRSHTSKQKTKQNKTKPSRLTLKLSETYEVETT